MAKKKRLTEWQKFEREWTKTIRAIGRKTAKLEREGYSFGLQGVVINIKKPSKFASRSAKQYALEALKERATLSYLRGEAEFWEESRTGVRIGNPSKGKLYRDLWPERKGQMGMVSFPSSPKEIRTAKKNIPWVEGYEDYYYVDDGKTGRLIEDVTYEPVEPVEPKEPDFTGVEAGGVDYDDIPITVYRKLELIEEFVYNYTAPYDANSSSPFIRMMAEGVEQAQKYLAYMLQITIHEQGRYGVAKNIEASGVDVENAINGIKRESKQSNREQVVTELVIAINGGILSTEQAKIVEPLSDALNGYEVGDEEGEF